MSIIFVYLLPFKNLQDLGKRLSYFIKRGTMSYIGFSYFFEPP